MDIPADTLINSVLLAMANGMYLLLSLLLRGVGKIADVAEEEGLTKWLTSRSSKVLTVTNIVFLIANALASIFNFDLTPFGALGYFVLVVLSIPLVFCFYSAIWGFYVFAFKFLSIKSFLSIIHLDFKYWLKMLYTFLLAYVQTMGAMIVIIQAILMYLKITPTLGG